MLAFGLCKEVALYDYNRPPSAGGVGRTKRQQIHVADVGEHSNIAEETFRKQMHRVLTASGAPTAQKYTRVVRWMGSALLDSESTLWPPPARSSRGSGGATGGGCMHSATGTLRSTAAAKYRAHAGTVHTTPTPPAPMSSDTPGGAPTAGCTCYMVYVLLAMLAAGSGARVRRCVPSGVGSPRAVEPDACVRCVPCVDGPGSLTLAVVGVCVPS